MATSTASPASTFHPTPLYRPCCHFGFCFSIKQTELKSELNKKPST